MTRFFYFLNYINYIILTSAVLLTSTISFNLWATTLTVSDNLIVSEVDDTIVEHGFISKKATFTLKQGEHALIVRYKDVFEDLDFAEDRVVESQSFVVKFSVENEKQLKLATVSIKNLSDAKAFAKSPELVLKNERNKELKIELENVSDYKVAKQVDLAVNAYVSKQTVEKSKKPLLVETAAATKSIALSNNKQKTSNTLLQVDSLVMLKYWWKNASAQEKIQFKQYITATK